MNELKPKSGLASSEFWLVLVVLAIANAFPIIVQNSPDSPILQTVAVVVAGFVDTLVTLGYLVSRTAVKKASMGDKGYARTSSLVALFLALSVAATLFAGCSVNEDFVRGSELIYKAIAPEYLEYVNKDPKLEPIQKENCRNTVTAWKAMNEQWRKTLDE